MPPASAPTASRVVLPGAYRRRQLRNGLTAFSGINRRDALRARAGLPDRLTVLLLAKLGAGGRHAIAFMRPSDSLATLLRWHVARRETLLSAGTRWRRPRCIPILDFHVCFVPRIPHRAARWRTTVAPAHFAERYYRTDGINFL